MATDNGTEEYVADPILLNEEMRKVFVAGIKADSNDDELKTFFEGICGGTVTDHVVIRKDKEKKTVFGFLTFETSELVDEVLLKRSELVFNSRNLEVKRAVPKNNTSDGAHEKTKKLFIANLPKTGCSEEELKAYFDVRHPKKYGIVESVQLIKKKDGEGNKLEENKGFGFVMVSSEDMADKMAIQHATFVFGGRKIELKKSVPTGEDGGGRGRGRGRGRGASRGAGRGRGGGFQGKQQYGGGYGGGYGQEWGPDPYAQYNPYGDYSYGGYGGGGGGYGYGMPPRGRGAARGQGRYTPY